jgi:hypothetical protein
MIAHGTLVAKAAIADADHVAASTAADAKADLHARARADLDFAAH